MQTDDRNPSDTSSQASTSQSTSQPASQPSSQSTSQPTQSGSADASTGGGTSSSTASPAPTTAPGAPTTAPSQPLSSQTASDAATPTASTTSQPEQSDSANQQPALGARLYNGVAPTPTDAPLTPAATTPPAAATTTQTTAPLVLKDQPAPGTPVEVPAHLDSQLPAGTQVVRHTNGTELVANIPAASVPEIRPQTTDAGTSAPADAQAAAPDRRDGWFRVAVAVEQGIEMLVWAVGRWRAAHG
jgi:hypothetical protein